MPLRVNGVEIEHVIFKAPGINQEVDQLYANNTLVFESTIFVAKPTLTAAFTFDNTEKSPAITGYDPEAMTMTGTDSATAAGDYSVTFTLKKGYAWTDESLDPVTLTWSIAKRSVTIPTISNTTKTYNAGAQSPTIANVTSGYVTQSGTTSATNAGNYTVTWALVYPDSTVWTDGTNANKTGSWTIGKMSLTIPSISSAKSFSFIEGTTRSVTVANFNSTYENQSGTTSTSALGTYTITWSLKNTNNTQWSDKTTTNKTASWSIVWTNGISHYNNDLYNRGWYKANSLQFADRFSSAGTVEWNSDHFAILAKYVKTTDWFHNKTVHFLAKAVTVSGSPSYPVTFYIYDFKTGSDFGHTTNGSFATLNTDQYREYSGTNSLTSERHLGTANSSNNGSGASVSYKTAIQRIWIT